MTGAVAIAVFGLFHPVELEVQPAPGNVVMVMANGRMQALEGREVARLRAGTAVTGRDGAEGRFILSVPGKIRREFLGRLEVRASGKELLAIVTMDRETAVGSIVAAEGPPGAGVEALKAQAVVARSFLIAARGRHPGFDFCDTTHCQFLREPTNPGSPARMAAEATSGLVLSYQGRVIPALYSADCGGRTRSLEEAGWGVEDYPYFAVECPVRGRVSGHRIGLCQVGSAEMAKRGAGFKEILAHYFPAAMVEALGQ